MKNQKKQSRLIIISTVILAVLLILAVCIAFCISHDRKNGITAKSHKVYKSSLSEIHEAYDGTEDFGWLQAIEDTAWVMARFQFIYDTNRISTTLGSALDTNRHGDCAHLITWSLQEYGILKAGEHFYSTSKGTLSCKKDSKCFKHLKKHCDIIETGGISCSDTEKLKAILQIGDICCYDRHMNVVAGIDEEGNILYYDAGLVPTKKVDGKKVYTQKLTVPFSRKTETFKSYTLFGIIRIRED